MPTETTGLKTKIDVSIDTPDISNQHNSIRDVTTPKKAIKVWQAKRDNCMKNSGIKRSMDAIYRSGNMQVLDDKLNDAVKKLEDHVVEQLAFIEAFRQAIDSHLNP